MIAVATSLFLLSIFVLFYSCSGIHIENKSLATDYIWESNQLKTNMVEGFSFMRMDEDGLNNAESFSDNKDVDILLMGSSQMEGVNVGRYENAGYMLNELVPDKRTYNIGISGHQLYNCVNNLPYALGYYDPSEYVVIVTDTVDMDVDLMQQVIDGEYMRIPSYDTGLVYLVQKWIPAVKTLYKNVADWRNAYAIDRGAEDRYDSDALEIIRYKEESDERDNEKYIRTLQVFLESVSDTVEEHDIKAIILYQSPISAVDYEQSDEEKANLDLFRSACETNGIEFIDMTESFKTMYKTEHKLPHGFINTAVGSGHLNKYGHKAIAEKLAKHVTQ